MTYIFKFKWNTLLFTAKLYFGALLGGRVQSYLEKRIPSSVTSHEVMGKRARTSHEPLQTYAYVRQSQAAPVLGGVHQRQRAVVGLAEDGWGGVRGRGGLQVEAFRLQPALDFHARSYPPALGLFEGELQGCLKKVISIIFIFNTWQRYTWQRANESSDNQFAVWICCTKSRYQLQDASWYYLLYLYSIFQPSIQQCLPRADMISNTLFFLDL